MIGFSEIYAKVLRKAWKRGGVVTSEQIASVLYFDGKPIPKDNPQRHRMIRNSIMTLRRMQAEGLISAVTTKGRINVYKVIGKDELKVKIYEELRQLFGEDFI